MLLSTGSNEIQQRLLGRRGGAGEPEGQSTSLEPGALGSANVDNVRAPEAELLCRVDNDSGCVVSP
jgi:hypothetical protein